MVQVSVVIPARDAAATLGACLDALALQDVPGANAELIVVDDGSVDQTCAIAQRPGVRVLRSAGRGPASARNVGARHARGEILVFLDADTVPRPGWLGEMQAPFVDPLVVAVKGRYYTFQRGLIPRFAQLEFEDKYARLERARRIDFVDTGTAAFRRDAFAASGGFDEAFGVPSAEDVELAFRLSASGARFVFNSAAGVWHQHAETLSAYLLKKLRYGVFRMEVYRRYPHKTLGDSYTPPVMAVQIGLVGCSWLLAGALVVRPRGVVRWFLAGVLGAFGLSTLPLTARATRRGPQLTLSVPPLVYARSAAQGVGITLGIARLIARRTHRKVEWRSEEQPATHKRAVAQGQSGDANGWHSATSSPAACMLVSENFGLSRTGGAG
jgi:cellulose synthase/poly-beta-1,6-N-acetylglucosamine synthase-like glycosyltransferase